MDKDLEKFLKEMLKDAPIDVSLNEMLTKTKNKVIEDEKEIRADLINLLKAERTSLLMKNGTHFENTDNKNFKKYERTINLAMKLTKLIDLMTIETLREDGA